MHTVIDSNWVSSSNKRTAWPALRECSRLSRGEDFVFSILEKWKITMCKEIND